MHAHRSAGHPVQSVAPPDQPPWSDRVRGLGVSDVLQLQLEPAQVPWLLDELEELRVAHEQGLIEAAGRRAACVTGEGRRLAEEDIAHHRHDLAVVNAIHAQVPCPPRASVLVCGPAPALSSIVYGAACGAAEELAELLGERRSMEAAAKTRALLDTASAVRAWVETLGACRTLEWFSFDVATPAEGRIEAR